MPTTHTGKTVNAIISNTINSIFDIPTYEQFIGPLSSCTESFYASRASDWRSVISHHVAYCCLCTRSAVFTIYNQITVDYCSAVNQFNKADFLFLILDIYTGINELFRVNFLVLSRDFYWLTVQIRQKYQKNVDYQQNQV